MSSKVIDKGIFHQGHSWDADRIADSEKSKAVAWRVAYISATVAVIAVVSAATLAPLKTKVPYIVRETINADGQIPNIEVLKPFDGQYVGQSELMQKRLASDYVLAREQYNWWLVGSDYDLVNRMTDESILPLYNKQFDGPQAVDKVFKDTTERKIRILSITPAPTANNQMVIRFVRSTTQKGVVVENPTVFVVNLSFRFDKPSGSETDMIRNPTGYKVFAYRRDAEAGAKVVDLVPGEAQ